MKVCSFLPAATQMLYDLGLQEYLYGVTFECPAPALAEKQKVVRCVLEDKHYSSAEIDRIFSASKARGQRLYYVDEAVLQAIEPDVIFTQDVCEVCQIDTACTAAAVAKLDKQPQVIPLTPQTLDDVLATVVTIAAALGKEEHAYVHLQQLQTRMQDIVEAQRTLQARFPTEVPRRASPRRASPRRVMLMEWMEPVFNCGHWIPYQIAQAGGVDMLSNPGGDSVVTPWEKIVRYDPEVLVVAPCGFTTDRTLQELHLLTERPGWEQLQAVQTQQVFVADFDLFTQPSAATLVDGIALLAGLFRPEATPVPAHLRHKFRRMPVGQQTKAR